MARLRLFRDGRCVKTVVLGEELCRVGRAADNDLELTSASSSRHHFEVGLNPKGEGHQLKDLGSENGTFVDGVREYSRALKKRAIIQVGEDVMLYEPEEAAPGRAETASLPVWARNTLDAMPKPEPAETQHIAPAIQRRVQAERLSRLKPHLVLLGAPEERVFTLDQDVNTVGYGKVRVSLGPGKKGATTVLAEIYKEKDASFWVRAKGLFGKVQVDGKSQSKCLLRPGNVIELEKHQLRFERGLVE